MHSIKRYVAGGVWLLCFICQGIPLKSAPITVKEIRTVKQFTGDTTLDLGDYSNLAYDGKNGKIYLYDWYKNNIIETDTLGQYIRNFGSDLQPPDTLDEPSDIMVFRKFVWVLDGAGSRVFQFTTDGKFVGSFSTRVRPFSFTGSGDYLYCSQPFGSDRIIPHNLYTGETKKGFSKKLSKFTMIIGFLGMF